MNKQQKNVLGGDLEACSFDPITGFIATVAVIPALVIPVHIPCAQS